LEIPLPSEQFPTDAVWEKNIRKEQRNRGNVKKGRQSTEKG
jgi:hypothetical protein